MLLHMNNSNIFINILILSVLISFLSFRTFYPWLGFYIFFHITPFFPLLFLSFPLSFFFFLSFFLSSLLFFPFFLFPFWGSKKISGTIGAVVCYIFLPWFKGTKNQSHCSFKFSASIVKSQAELPNFFRIYQVYTHYIECIWRH